MVESMKANSNKRIWIVLQVVLFFLCACASTQMERTESKDAVVHNTRGIDHVEKANMIRPFWISVRLWRLIQTMLRLTLTGDMPTT